jgi:hypothetical protein
MKKRLFLTLILFLILFSFCLATEEKIVMAEVTFYNSGQSPELKSLTLIEGYVMETDVGQYAVNILDDSNTQLFNVSFGLNYSISGINEPLKSVTKTFYLPYFEKSNKLVISENGEVILEKNIFDLLCNHNQKCETYENFASCPNDCASNSKDDYCNPNTDSVCDPDCYEGVDYDCYLEQVKQNTPVEKPTVPTTKPTVPDKNNTVPQSDNSPSIFSLLIPAFVLVLAVVILGVFFLLIKRYRQ